MDMGRKIGRYARELTPEQLAELLAIQQTAISVRRPMPALSINLRDPMYKSLIGRGILIKGDPPRGFESRRWRSLTISKLGMHVLFARIENELLAAGAIPQPAEVEPD